MRTTVFQFLQVVTCVCRHHKTLKHKQSQNLQQKQNQKQKGNEYESYNITVFNVTFIHSHGATIGPYVSPKIDTIKFENITMINTIAGPHIKGRCNDINMEDNPGIIQNVIYNHFILINLTICDQCAGWPNITGTGIVIDMRMLNSHFYFYFCFLSVACVVCTYFFFGIAFFDKTRKKKYKKNVHTITTPYILAHMNGIKNISNAVCSNSSLLFRNITVSNILNVQSPVPNYSWFLQGLNNVNITNLSFIDIDIQSKNGQFCENAQFAVDSNVSPRTQCQFF